VQATLIHNPTAGSRGMALDLAAVRAVLDAYGWTLRDAATDAPGAATALAREAVARGDDVVIVAGGDGTINEVVQALAGTPVALGVLPIGTVNVWALELGLPLDPVEAAQALAEGECRAVDLGRAGERYFLLMAGIGFDGAVTGLVESRLKRIWGRWAYVIAGARLALRYGGVDATLEMDGGTVRCRLLLAVIGNTRLYAGRLTLTASAVADDGLLDVVVFTGRRLWQALPRLLPLLLRRTPHGAGVLYYRTRRLRVTTGEPLPVQADGDYVGTTPLDFAVAPAALRVIVPHGLRVPLFAIPIAPPEHPERHP
jgi:YegS/Rv2252/BmrU family lipid kinase